MWLPNRVRQFVNPWQDPATGRPLIDGVPLQGPGLTDDEAHLVPQTYTVPRPNTPTPATAQIVRPLPDQPVRVSTDNGPMNIVVSPTWSNA
jgi:hypothetical protein